MANNNIEEMRDPLKKIKICHIVNSMGIGGVEKFVIELVNRLDPTLFDVYIVSLSTEVSLINNLKLNENIKFFSIEYEFSKNFNLSDLYNHALNKRYSQIRAKSLSNLLKEISPNIIHAHVLPRELSLIKILASVCNCKILYTDHSVRFSHSMKLHSKLIIAIAFKFLYNNINVIPVSISVFQFNNKYHIYDSSKIISVIENGIHIPELDITERNQKKLVLVYVSRISHFKGHEDLIRAWKRLPERENISLKIIGPDELNGKMQALATSLIKDNSIEFLGPLYNVSEYLKVADLAVFPSYREGLPLALLEKMANYIPVIAADIPELKDIIADGYNGLLYKSGDVEDLKNKIQILIDSKSLRNKLGFNARKSVEDRFDINIMVKKYEAVYLKLLRQNGSHNFS